MILKGDKRRVVVTGLGTVNPLGLTVQESWQGIIEGRSGVAPITRFDAKDLPVQIAAELKHFDIGQYLPAKEARRMDLFIHYGMAAGIQAVGDSGISIHSGNADRIGINIGSGIGGLRMIEETHHAFLQGGWRKVSPFFIPSTIINMVSGNLSIFYGIKGPNLAVVTACSSALHAIGEAMRSIQAGDADVMLAGGAEGAITPLAIAGFAAAKSLSRRNDEPERASRPWDKDRDGFVLGEGAGVVVLEEYEHAKARGAKIYCEVLGYGLSSDAYHITAPPEDGDGAVRSMLHALGDAGISPNEIDYINAHGTSTPVGDRIESLAIKRVFKDHAYRLAVSSTKSMTGHLLGAAGGIEAVFSILTIRDGIIPPTINLDEPDDDCDLDFVPNEARRTEVKTVLTNSFGFGGTNASLIFRRL
jgi:3-oxoacyl-[acyl-carrier-protein] synthase II